MSQPASLITIVVPVYNRAGIVERTLESIRQQSHRPLSVVLVDNNSTDNTPHVLRKWKSEVEAPDMQVTIVDEPVAGAPAARNRGLGLTTTPYVMFFDSDDIMTPT
ncbi:MAG: glycosyltransferase family 2 protein, partial [Muribaculaceae bacterium]|nr:glycosyltransferase family 2 protein [Muribaculaceae bacterium]